ncbi:hypothetical protein K0M31_007675 [Melipona bicolor]|uniref:Uncharacterized protein n=1 Tax=Melipona bicolor TaxID=60889 RepID=A0AA40KW93_9HYME|nr:hypothetical protein K0M31_007675 [Melipona bicolor]
MGGNKKGHGVVTTPHRHRGIPLFQLYVVEKLWSGLIEAKDNFESFETLRARQTIEGSVLADLERSVRECWLNEDGSTGEIPRNSTPRDETFGRRGRQLLALIASTR